MATLPGQAGSYWIAGTPQTDYPPLSADAGADVCVIGGGIVGITAAFLLKKQGARVCLLESRRMATGVSGHTSAKVTALHSAIYRTLVDKHGVEVARRYADANRAGLDWIAQTVEERALECDFRRDAAYTVAAGDGGVRTIENEAKVTQQLGLPVEYLDAAGLSAPMAAAAGVRWPDQAHFHPRKYLLALAESLPGDGTVVHENSRATGIREEGTGCFVDTLAGTVWADRVIVATGMPFLRQTSLYTRALPVGHPLLAVRTGGSPHPGMYLSLDSHPHSARPQPDADGDALILVGEGRQPGHGSTIERFRELLDHTQGRLAPTAIDYRWWTEDFYSVDALPYVGKLGMSRRVLTATGFGGWGMTNGTAAALILADLAGGRDNDWSDLFDPGRITVSASQQAFIDGNLEAVKEHVVKARLTDRRGTVSDIAEGEGRIVQIEGDKAAVARDGGEVRAVSPTCTHLGCYVEWNDAERTWDCPCHGSRFTSGGEMIQAPAVSDLARVEIAEE